MKTKKDLPDDLKKFVEKYLKTYKEDFCFLKLHRDGGKFYLKSVTFSGTTLIRVFYKFDGEFNCQGYHTFTQQQIESIKFLNDLYYKK